MRGVLIRAILVAVVFSVTVIGSGALLLNRWAHQPLNLSENGGIFVVDRGDTAMAIARRLRDREILERPQWFGLWTQLTGDAARIKAGEYTLLAGDTPVSLLERMVGGEVVLHEITIIEGWSLRELMTAMREHPAIETQLLADSPEDIATLLELPVRHAEGQFFPDTYRFERGTSDRELLLQANRRMEQQLAEAWDSRKLDLVLDDPYQALILASIIEKEALLDRERPRIAGVLVRRLEKGMLLQTDPTVIYGLGPDFDGDLRRRDLAADGPYNTYKRKGLPPTPIALPGRASLMAAAQPAEGEDLFFVASGLGDGSHVFSRTLEEHNDAVSSYLARLRDARESGADP